MTTNDEWTCQDSADLYHVGAWGRRFLDVGKNGDLWIYPRGPQHEGLDLKVLMDELVTRGLCPPLLLRFSDILDRRLRSLAGAFAQAKADYGYQAGYRPAVPIKVNQQRHVVEELLHYGKAHGLGLEVGSKPELLVALGLADSSPLIICNGYKDSEYIETALLASKLGREAIIVIDRYEEIEVVIAACRKLGIRPRIGARAKLAAAGAGRWAGSTGAESKFGLGSTQLVRLVKRLESAGMLDCLVLLHFHMGSQIPDIRAIKKAMREAGRIYVALHQLGAPLGFLDVGGGLAVDYDGTRSANLSSRNYSQLEYAADVVCGIMDALEDTEIPHPELISESGRALLAHHAVLVVNVLGVSSDADPAPPRPGPDDHRVLHDLQEALDELTPQTYQESYHDALSYREEAHDLFNHGLLNLEEHAWAERLAAATLLKVLELTEELEYVPDELQELPRLLADTYFCNFSVFQSLPDHWAIGQVFPIMPLHRLDQEPSRRASLVDLTCDSDGKLDQFVHPRGPRSWLQLHAPDGDPYYLGVFLVGAYQETLGDLHNLFGDTNVVHVRCTEHGYELKHVVHGDSVEEVLSYVEYRRADLVEQVRLAAEQALREGRLSAKESRALLERYQSGLNGYTYLEEEDLPWQAE
jgi:arginine decarboxylase